MGGDRRILESEAAQDEPHGLADDLFGAAAVGHRRPSRKRNERQHRRHVLAEPEAVLVRDRHRCQIAGGFGRREAGAEFRKYLRENRLVDQSRVFTIGEIAVGDQAVACVAVEEIVGIAVHDVMHHHVGHQHQRLGRGLEQAQPLEGLLFDAAAEILDRAIEAKPRDCRNSHDAVCPQAKKVPGGAESEWSLTRRQASFVRGEPCSTRIAARRGCVCSYIRPGLRVSVSDHWGQS